MGTLEIELANYPKVGDLLPNFRYLDEDGQTQAASDFQGKIVFIDFWATWCAPCIATLPEMNTIHKMMESSDDAKLLGLNLDTDLNEAKTFLSKRSLPWDHGFLGTLKDPQRSLGIGSVPHYGLIGADGTILEWGGDLEKIKARLKTLLEQ